MPVDYFRKYEKKTSWVVLLTTVTMAIEIYFGITSKSMALLADGIHMGSHVLAIGLSWIAYIYIRKFLIIKYFSGDHEKILSLSGYTSGILLIIFALLIFVNAIQRFLLPQEINYQEAIFIASIGLIINIASALLLKHDHKHSDHNIRAAYLHVIADALTSFSAILGLTAAMIWDIVYIDTIAALISSLIIIKWSVKLLKESGKILLKT